MESDLHRLSAAKNQNRVRVVAYAVDPHVVAACLEVPHGDFHPHRWVDRPGIRQNQPALVLPARRQRRCEVQSGGRAEGRNEERSREGVGWASEKMR